MPNRSFSINGTDLDAITNVDITAINASDIPDRDVRTHKLARQDKSIVTSQEFSTKGIIVEGVIGDENQAANELTWGTILNLARKENFTAIFDKRGQNITYTNVNLSSTTTEQKGGFMSFSLAFEAADPIGLLGSMQLLQPNLITGATSSFTLTVSGDMPACPLITVTFVSLAGGTAATVTVKNSGTGRGITVTRTYGSGDVMSIDCINQTIEINGGEVEYTGTFPQFENGESLQYVDNFTSRQTTISATYQPRIL